MAACTVPITTKTNETTWFLHCHIRLHVAILWQFLSMLSTDGAIGRTADIIEKTAVSLIVSETDVRSVGFDLPCSEDGPYSTATRCRPSSQAY